MKYNLTKQACGGMAMDAGYEDKIYKQVEKSLSENFDAGFIRTDEISTPFAGSGFEGARLTRAELINQARQACLRQMNTTNVTGRVKGFKDTAETESRPEEIASYRYLIIRTVCAVVIFISIFIIDRIKLDWGTFSYETIRHYVTGNNHLKALEELIASWLK